MKRELVKNWMSAEVVSVTPDTSLAQAHKMLNDYKIRRLPVTKNGRLVGMVTLGDVREAEPSDATTLSVWEANYLLAKLTVKSIMTRDLITILPDATIGEAAKLMLEHKISGLPVVNDDQKIVGIITESDIFRIVVREWEQAEAEPVLEVINTFKKDF